MKRRLRFAARVALALALAARTSAAQQPTFRSDTQLVSIVATVVDHHKRPVTNLEADDFEVLDDGQPQPLAYFAIATQPITTVVMLDTSASTTLELAEIRDAAEQFVLRMLPGDRARICAFNDKIQFSPAFTSDRDALARSVREVDFGNGTRLYDALAASLDALAQIDGRRVILLFTDGNDTDSSTKLRSVLARARVDEVTVYVIGLEGREFNGDEFVDTEPDIRLRKLATDTGGGYFDLERSSDLASTFRRVSEELHSQYVLAFAPTSLDGRRHKLTVRVKHSRVTVQARRSYLARR